MGFFQIGNYSIQHSYFSDESMLKIWPEDKSVPMSWKFSSGSRGSIFQPCFFNVTPFFFCSVNFPLQTASKQQVLWYILFRTLPYKSWHYKDPNRIRKKNQSCFKNSSFKCEQHNTEWYWWYLSKPQINCQSSVAQAGRNSTMGNEGNGKVLQVVNTPGSQLGQPDSWHMLDDAHHLTNTQDRDFRH